MFNIIVTKLRHANVIGPIRLVYIHVVSQILLQNQVHSFRLPISLRPKGRAHFELRAQFLPKRTPETTRKPRIPIRNDIFLHHVVLHLLVEIQSTYFLCRRSVPRRHEMCHLTNFINDHHDGVEPLDSRKWVMKSIETLSQHLVGMGNGLNNPASLQN